jgi:hypothetical protein
MDTFWNKYPDQTLSLLDLAEKKWCLANDKLVKLETYCATHCGRYNQLGEIVDCDDDFHLLAERMDAYRLLLQYTALKSSELDKQNERPASATVKEEPKLDLTRLKARSQFDTFEDLFNKVQGEINGCKYKNQMMVVFTAKFQTEDVSRMVRILLDNDFHVRPLTGCIEFKYKL